MDNSLSFAKRLKKLNKNSIKILLNEIGLDKESKEILYKRYVEEMSLVEIANELGYTKESTNNLLAKSRRVLEDIILEQLMRAINAFAIGCDFHENASLDSHKLGLQGFKRLHRYFSRKDNESKMKLEHYCIDMFGEKVMPDWDKLEKPKMSNTVKEMLESYLEHETEKYATIAEIANILTMNEFLHESHMLRKELEPVTREIIKCKRYIQDFENSDWSWHHIRYIDNMLHTKYKEKECEEFSYKD